MTLRGGADPGRTLREAGTADAGAEHGADGRAAGGWRPWIIATLSLAVVLLLADRLVPRKQAAITANDHSIAVLPFANTSGDADNEYFSDGLSEELITSLSWLNDLKVIGRTSSFQFKGQTEDSAAIGQKLGVVYLLEGSVRKAIELQPQDAQSYGELALLQIQRGHAAAAIDLAKQETDPFGRTYALALAYSANGNRTEADAELKILIDQYQEGGAFQIAQVYALRKDTDHMFEWLNHGLATRDPGVMTLRYALFVRDYSADPRFMALCNELGLYAPGDAPPVADAKPAQA